jgi:endonuclease/exonuclease/phosphatase family metal-dependent hydrolase
MRRVLHLRVLSIASLVLVTVLSGEDLRIATYNVNNYLVMDRMVGERWRPAYPKSENEKTILRRIIKEVSPDILVLQEMGPVDFLEELRADLSREGVHYDYAIHMKGTDADRHLAVLSIWRPEEVVKHTDLDFKYFDRRETVKRGMLELRFGLSDGEFFQLFTVHLKSRYTENKEDFQSGLRRAREAEACRNRLIERTHERGLTNYLVAGDFNDHPVSSAMRRFYFRGDLELGARIPAADSRGEVWTYHYKKEARYESVDGFVASHGMKSRIKAGQAHIVDSSGALAASDHRMVYLDIVLDSKPASSR